MNKDHLRASQVFATNDECKDTNDEPKKKRKFKVTDDVESSVLDILFDHDFLLKE